MDHKYVAELKMKLARASVDIAFYEANAMLKEQPAWVRYMDSLAKMREAYRDSLESGPVEIAQELRGSLRVISGLLSSGRQAETRLAFMREEANRFEDELRSLTDAGLEPKPT